MPAHVALLAYRGCDLLDLGGPYEALLTANRMAARRGEPAPFAVVVASPDGAAVSAYGGLGLVPHRSAGSLDDLAALVVPGTIDVDHALADAELIGTVAALAARAERVASVCTGAFVLAAAGLLVGRRATTHHEDRAALAARADVGQVAGACRFVDDGGVLTAAGLSCGLDLGLALVDRLAGRDVAAAAAANLAYRWDPRGLAPLEVDDQPTAAPPALAPHRLALGEPGPLRQRLNAAVLAGDKIATTCLQALYDLAGQPLPEPGQTALLLDDRDEPLATVRTTGVDQRRLADVDAAIAHDEGEGFADVADWRRVHEAFWNRWRQAIRDHRDDPHWELTDDEPVVVHRFTVVDRHRAAGGSERTPSAPSG